MIVCVSKLSWSLLRRVIRGVSISALLRNGYTIARVQSLVAYSVFALWIQGHGQSGHPKGSLTFSTFSHAAVLLLLRACTLKCKMLLYLTIYSWE